MNLQYKVGNSIAIYGKYTGLRACVVFGGVKINPQMMNLRRGADILVATPGRLMDLYNQNAVKFSQLAKTIVRNPVEIDVSPRNTTADR